MASTYTDELRIEKIATGEQSGSWGTTTNTQYDLWESTISGTATVAFASDGNDTLTTANGADDEARHMFINLSGGTSLSTTRNLVVPTKSKLYFVRNNTNGSQAVVVKTSSGSGITVPHGKYMCLYCYGTNVIDATNYQTAMTIGTMTSASVAITGGSISGITDLAVADGGTGASSLTDGGVLLGSGTGAITAMAVLADGEMIVGDGTTDPVAESGATLRTSIGLGSMADVNTGSVPAQTLAGAITGADQIVSAINLKDYGEVTQALGSAGGTRAVNLNDGNSVTATVATSANTFTFSNPTASDELCGFTLELTNGGSQTVNWPASVDWAGASAPTLTTSGVDYLVFWTVNGGTKWYGGLVGNAFA